MIILGITPARGGSKGIPRKNSRTIAGKPLIAWTIEAAEKSKLLTRYVVSTEDREIAEVSRRCGAEVLERPSGLATDEATTLSVLQHAARQISSDAIAVISATSPIRGPHLIDECIREFIDNKYDSLATGFICKNEEYTKSEARRQDIPGFFYDDGNVYIIKTDLVRKGERYGRRIGRKIISRWENVDINDEFDFWVAEKILLDSTRQEDEKNGKN